MPDAEDRRRGRAASRPADGRPDRRATSRRGRATAAPRPSGHKRVRPEVYRRRRLVRGRRPRRCVVALLVGAVAWYQSQTGGIGGRSVVVTVPAGSSMGTVTATLVRAPRHRQLAGLPGLSDSPRHAHGAARALPPAPRRVLRRRPGHAWRPGPTSSSVDVLPGFTITEVATQVGQIAGPRPRPLPLPGQTRGRALALRAGRVDQPRRPGRAPGTYLVVPGESRPDAARGHGRPVRHAWRTRSGLTQPAPPRSG